MSKTDNAPVKCKVNPFLYILYTHSLTAGFSKKIWRLSFEVKVAIAPQHFYTAKKLSILWPLESYTELVHKLQLRKSCKLVNSYLEFHNK